jgi:hypothetical protein
MTKTTTIDPKPIDPKPIDQLLEQTSPKDLLARERIDQTIRQSHSRMSLTTSI